MSAVELTRSELVAMLDALRERYLADKGYLECPIGRLAGRFLKALEFDNYSDNTVRNREQTLGWLAWDHQELHPRDVDVTLLRSFLEKHWATAAPTTKAIHVSSLRVFFTWVHDLEPDDEDWLPVNPARKLKTPRGNQSTERRAHPIETIRQLVVAQDNRLDRLAILLMYWCGLRRNELRVVQWRHIDLYNRSITVFGKGRTVLPVNLNEEIAMELERYVLDEAPEPDDFLIYPRLVGLKGAYPLYSRDVIYDRRKTGYTKSGIDRWFQRCRDKANLPEHIVMHELRHSQGTHAQQHGHDLLATSKLLRHRSTAVTERHYLHLDAVETVSRVQKTMPRVLEDGE